MEIWLVCVGGQGNWHFLALGPVGADAVRAELERQGLEPHLEDLDFIRFSGQAEAVCPMCGHSLD